MIYSRNPAAEARYTVLPARSAKAVLRTRDTREHVTVDPVIIAPGLPELTRPVRYRIPTQKNGAVVQLTIEQAVTAPTAPSARVM
ncbi:MAG: hypothetical protein WC342_06895 [Methanoregula sp.]